MWVWLHDWTTTPVGNRSADMLVVEGGGGGGGGQERAVVAAATL